MEIRERDSGAGEPPARFWGRFWPPLLLGLLGIAMLPAILVPMIRRGPVPEPLHDLPLPVLVAITMINPILYLAIAAAIGAALTPRLGLTSLIVNRRTDSAGVRERLRSVAAVAVPVGLLAAVLIVTLDRLARPLLSPEWRDVLEAQEATRSAIGLLSGMLYGGITEEVMLRWGALTLFAWVGWRLLQRGRGRPSPSVLWTATILAALLFGAAHLPAAAMLGPLEIPAVLRIVLINAAGGVLYGWLFWRYHLEAAMLAHASTHVGFALLALVNLA